MWYFQLAWIGFPSTVRKFNVVLSGHSKEAYDVKTGRSVTEGSNGAEGGDDENHRAHDHEGDRQTGNNVPQVESPIGQLLHEGQDIVADEVNIGQDQDTRYNEGQGKNLGN